MFDIRDGKLISHFGEKGEGDGQFEYPRGLALTENKLFVADVYNGRISVWNWPELRFLEHFGSRGNGPNQLTEPRGISNDQDCLYIADCGNHRIQVWSLTGTPIKQFGSQVNEPLSVIVSKTEVFVTDGGNDRVCIFDAISGECLRLFGKKGKGDGEFDWPYGMAMLPNGQLIVTDRDNCRLQFFE
jgi:DNA-binding beta-propeller fold protein YncE